MYFYLVNKTTNFIESTTLTTAHTNIYYYYCYYYFKSLVLSVLDSFWNIRTFYRFQLFSAVLHSVWEFFSLFLFRFVSLTVPHEQFNISSPNFYDENESILYAELSIENDELNCCWSIPIEEKNLANLVHYAFIIQLVGIKF